MCRYAIYPVKQKFACFQCRKVFKSYRSDKKIPSCPECKQPMNAMGFDFKAPKQTNIEQWRKVHLLFLQGYAYHSCGCQGPGERPQTFKEVPDFQKQKQEQAAEWQRQSKNSERAYQLQQKRNRARRQYQEKLQARLLRKQEQKIKTEAF